MFHNVKSQLHSINRLMQTYAVFYILSTCVLTAFFVITGILFTLQNTAMAKESRIKNVYEGKRFYTIVDNFYDADAFYEFRQHSKNINRLGEFYNGLVESSKLEFISIFNQPINIKQYKGDAGFLYNSQEFRNEKILDTSNVKAIQLNSAAFELYQLSAAQGLSIDWHAVDYQKGVLPVLLGADYNGVYAVGSTFKGNFYGRTMTFEVVGLLEPNTFVYYKGNPEFYLDKYIVMPYPELCKSVDAMDFHFEGILYFAMINGDAATTLGEKSFLREIKNIADSTEFTDFSVVGIPILSMRYAEMISVIKENQRLLSATMLLVGILVAFIQCQVGNLILARRLDVYQAYWLIGDGTYRFIYLRDISLPYIIAYGLSVIIIGLCFQYFSFLSTLFPFTISGGLLAFVYFINKPGLLDSVQGRI